MEHQGSHHYSAVRGHLEKGMAAHSSILAWRIPWTEKPGGLQSDYVSLVNFGASVVVQTVKNPPAMQETWV